MAKFVKCDGCEKISPDYTQKSGGPHIANHWTEIIVKCKKSWSFYSDENPVNVLLCEECLPHPESLCDETGWAKSIIAFFSRKYSGKSRRRSTARYK